MKIFTLVIFDIDHSTYITHIEHYSEKPNPRTEGFFIGAIPRWELHQGDLDGGDTTLIDRNVPNHILSTFLDQHYGHNLDCKGL